MATTISWGSQSATFNLPKELATFGHPQPPRQQIASWAAELAAFQALCTGSQFREATEFALANCVLVSNADVPGGSLTALQTYLRNTFPLQNSATLTGLPPCFNTASGQTWRAA